MKHPLIATLVTVFLLSACGTRPPRAVATSAAPVKADVVIPETWVTPPSPDDELDSLAVWPNESGAPWVIASAKSTHRLVVFDGDSGQRLREVGGRGQLPGQFNRPNGLAVFGDLLFVVERDNHRLQVFELPSFKPLLTFGADVLRTPYGLWLHETAPGQLELYVTDSYMIKVANGKLSGDKENDWIPPQLPELGERIKRFRIDSSHDGTLSAKYLGAFGETREPGALRMVESIAGDALHQRLLIAEEYPRGARTLREYSLDGRYLKRDLPAFSNDPEGIALWVCRAGEQGYWVAADQLKPTVFRLFARDSLTPVASFSGIATADTDGIALHTAGSARFPGGVLYAMHQDRSIGAFDLIDIARSLKLGADCQP